MLKRSSRRVIIFHENMGRIDENVKEYDIFLTPKYYIVRREKLPIKFLFQAKKLAPSILDELIEDSEDTSYVVYRDKDEWVFIAYNPKIIYDESIKIGLDPDNARSMYFAEQIRDRLKQPICLGDSALAVVEGYVTLIPKSFAGENGCKSIDVASLELPKSYASAGKSSTLSATQSYIIATSLTLIALAIFAEGVRYSKAAQRESDRVADVADGDVVLISKISRDNILQKYRRIDRKERDKRETLKKIGSLLSNSVSLVSFKSDENGYEAKLRADSASAMATLERKVKHKGFSYKKIGMQMRISGRWR